LVLPLNGDQSVSVLSVLELERVGRAMARIEEVLCCHVGGYSQLDLNAVYV
jgi:hypothetical protein